ncbi:ROK family glucokinase [Micrococcales bacterium 31B]|nr:ROK family glucokinase [Micrococcales bacterium 31B]
MTFGSEAPPPFSRRRSVGSPISRLFLERALTVGIDIGGTRVKAGVVDHYGNVLERMNIPTPTRSPQSTEEAIVSVVTELRRRHDIRAVGIGAAGFIDAQRATVLFSPHLAWRNEPLRDAVQSRIGLRTVVENDANAAAWAESRFGAGVNESHVVTVTLGTGIGGGIVTNGEVDRGRFGVAGEFGHMQLVPSGRRCECGNRGCWEQYAGGSALIREARELASSGSPVVEALMQAAGGDLQAIDGQVVTEVAREGDPACRELLTDLGQWLGLGLANLAAALDPGVFVIGGGVSAAGPMILEPAREAFGRQFTGRGYRPMPRIVQAKLGNDAGFIGAADLARYTVDRRSGRSEVSPRRLEARQRRAERARRWRNY